MDRYTFTHTQLYSLLQGAIDLRDEYLYMHGKDAREAAHAAIQDTIEGLDAEQDLLTIGERFTPSQVIVEEMT